MTTTSKKRRLHFGLRTLLVGVALVACLTRWVMYQQDWIRQRHHVLEQVNAADVVRDDDLKLQRHVVQAWTDSRKMQILYSDIHRGDSSIGEPDVVAKAPLSLRPFGESGIGLMLITFDSAQSRPLNDEEELELGRIKQLFPEAYVRASV